MRSFALALTVALAATAAARDANLRTAADLGLSKAQFDALDDIPGSDFIRNGFDISNDTVSQYVSGGGETSRLPVYKYTYEQQATYTSPYTKTTYKVADQLSTTTDTQVTVTPSDGVPGGDRCSPPDEAPLPRRAGEGRGSQRSLG